MVNSKLQGRNAARDIDKKWANIFDDFKVLERIEENGSFLINSKQIKRYKEARLMTKFDYRNSLPDLFFDNDLAILPITRGNYIIGHFEAYKDIENKSKTFREDIEEVEFPNWIETIDTENMTSESTVISAAFASKMIHRLYDDDEILNTVNGRMSSKDISFNINGVGNHNKQKIFVKNSQLEIDGGFETPEKLLIFEAKNSSTDNFLVRQLFYPYKLWENKIDKEVVPIYLQYHDNVFNFSIFEVEDNNNYNSLKLVKRKNFRIGKEETSFKDIVEVYKRVKVSVEPQGIPFPQADNFSRVIDLLGTIYTSEEGSITKEQLTIYNNFTYRQADYYANASKYLGLTQTGETSDTITLTPLCENIMNLSDKNKKLALIEQIFKHKVFKMVFEKRLSTPGVKLKNKDYVQLIVNNNLLPNYNITTINRRSSTIRGWIDWILQLTDDY